MNVIQQAIETFRDSTPISDPVMVFAVVMLIILIAPLLSVRLRMPGIIGILVAGAIIGENGLDILRRDDTIQMLGTVGLLYLMFVVGMSMDLHQFSQMRSRSVGFGAMSFAIPQVLGVTAGLMLLGYNVATALLLGSIVGSHTLLAYPVAKRLGITRNPAVTMSMGGTIVTDALALSVLAVVVAMSAGDIGPGFWAKFIILVGSFAVAVILGLPLLGRWYFRNIQGRGDLDFVFLMAVLFVSAALSDWVGLAPIVGAFLAGLTMNRLVPDSGPLMNRLHFVGDALFIPFFLLSVGMLINFKVLFGQWEVWWLTTVFTGLVLGGKTAAALISRFWFGYSPAEGWTIAGLTIPQAAATLAVTLVGYRLGLFGETEVNAVVVMILITCVLGSWVVERNGRRVALLEKLRPEATSQQLQRILIPLANPSSAPALLDVAFTIRQQDAHEPVYPLTVANEAADVSAQVSAGERMLGYAVIYCSGAGVPVTPVTRIDTNVANGISRALKELQITHVVIGWTGEASARKRTFGSILDQMLESNPQTMLVCRLIHPLNTLQRIILILPRFADREPGFDDAIRTVKQMANGIGAKLVVFTPGSDAEPLSPREAPRVIRRIEAAKPAVSTTFSGIGPAEGPPETPPGVGRGTPRGASYVQLLESLDAELESDDLIVLLNSREGRLSWRPEMNRMPRQFVDRYQKHNLIVMYPSELASREVWNESQSQPTPLLLDRNRIALHVEETQVSQVLRRLLQPQFEQRPETIRRICEQLERNTHDYSTEVSRGVSLLHAHVPEVTSPMVFLATSEQGIEIPRIENPVHVLLVLLSPAMASPEEHLGSLAGIAQMMNHPDVADRLRKTQTFEDLYQVLTEIEK